MAELLTHVLLAYALFTIASWRVGWLDGKWVAIGMVGATLPDLDRLWMVVRGDRVSAVLGIPFDWAAIHTLGGVVLLSGVVAMLFGSRHRRLAFGMLVMGGCTHLALDGLKAGADGHAGASLVPLSWWRPPAPGWYVSADAWVAIVAVAVALCVLILDEYVVVRVG